MKNKLIIDPRVNRADRRRELSKILEEMPIKIRDSSRRLPEIEVAEKTGFRTYVLVPQTQKNFSVECLNSKAHRYGNAEVAECTIHYSHLKHKNISRYFFIVRKQEN